MTPGYARSVGQIAYAWGWPMVNIQSRRLMYTQVMTLLAKAKGGRRRAPRKSAAMPPPLRQRAQVQEMPWPEPWFP